MTRKDRIKNWIVDNGDLIIVGTGMVIMTGAAVSLSVMLRDERKLTADVLKQVKDSLKVGDIVNSVSQAGDELLLRREGVDELIHIATRLADEGLPATIS